jgi:hypothetical protein
VLLGEIEIDGHGFPKLEPIVIDGRDPAVRIHREIFLGLGTPVGEMDGIFS